MRNSLSSPGRMSISLPQSVKSFTNSRFGQQNLGSPNVNQGIAVPQSFGRWSTDSFNASRPVTTAINGLDSETMWSYAEKLSTVLGIIAAGLLIYNTLKGK